MLLVLSVERDVPFESLAHKPVPQPFDDQRSSAFLVLFEPTRVSPTPNGGSLPSLEQLPERLVDSPTLGRPHGLSMCPQVLLTLKRFHLQFFILHRHFLIKCSSVSPHLLMGILLPVVKVAVQVIVIHMDDSTLYTFIH